MAAVCPISSTYTRESPSPVQEDGGKHDDMSCGNSRVMNPPIRGPAECREYARVKGEKLREECQRATHVNEIPFRKFHLVIIKIFGDFPEEVK